MLKWLIVFHVLGASIWVGGHLLLTFRYLPESLRKKDLRILLDYESKYEPIGFPALIIQLITGIWMAVSVYNVNLFGWSNPVEKAVTLKLVLLLTIIALAANVRFRILPKLTLENVNVLAMHIITVTVISVLMVYLGISVRFGGI